MTEADWLASLDPEPMLQFMRGEVSDRKLRLFACGSCRRIWDLLTTAAARAAVETGERFADGLATSAEREAAWRSCRDTVVGPDGNFLAAEGTLRWSIADAACWAAAPLGKDGTPLPGTEVGSGVYRSAAGAKAQAAWDNYVRARHGSTGYVEAAKPGLQMNPVTECYARAFKEANAARQSETSAQAALLRDILGNPFRTISIDPVWLQGQGAAVSKIAQEIYDDRSFDRMPRLAIALNEAGCTNADIVVHCKNQGEHVRGCWVLDLLLGRA